MRIEVKAVNNIGSKAMLNEYNRPMTRKEKTLVKRKIVSKSPLTVNYHIRIPNWFYSNPLVVEATKNRDYESEYKQMIIDELVAQGCSADDVSVEVFK